MAHGASVVTITMQTCAGTPEDGAHTPAPKCSRASYNFAFSEIKDSATTSNPHHAPTERRT